MKKIELINSRNQIDLEDVKCIEKTLNIKLPEDYKEFLLFYNGGKPLKNHFTSCKGDNIIGVDYFYSYCGGKNYLYREGDEYVDFMKENLHWKGFFPERFISIAYDPGGNTILICVQEGKYYGTIWFLCHEYEPIIDNLEFISYTFTDFINSSYFFVFKKGVEGYIGISKYDKYSLKFSIEKKIYGDILNEFFNKSINSEEYCIEESLESSEEVELKKKKCLLYYIVESEKKKYCCEIKDGKVVRDYVEDVIDES